MSRKPGRLIFLCILVLCTHVLPQDSTRSRQYRFGIYSQYDLRTSSGNAIAVNRALHDAFRKGITPRMGDKAGAITYSVYSFAVTYLSMLWSHEFGHSLRAAQVGGEFRIHDAGLPIPYTTMHLPDDITLVDEALSVTAGFEVNHLNVRTIQRRFVAQNGIPDEDLAFSFANRLMYPLYSSVIVPIDPEDRNVWIETAGDPVHVSLPVFRNYSEDRVFLADSSVNPDLVSYYNQSSIFALVWNLADPQLYRELGAAFGKKKDRKPIFLVGSQENGWTYGTLFNVSPLGYELYLNNYIHYQGRQFMLYGKYGRPFKNNGIGAVWTGIPVRDNLQLSVMIDVWDQDLFGTGVSGEVLSDWRLTDRVGVFAAAGYKTEGYLLGKQVPAGINLGAGLQLLGRY